MNDGAISSGYSTAARIAVTPTHSDQHVFHLGVSTRYRRTSETERLSYSAAPSFAPDEVALNIGGAGRSDIFTGVETAYVTDSFWFAAEYGITKPFLDEVNVSILSGGYIEAGFSVAGQKAFRNGRFTAPQIDRSVLEGGPGSLFAVIRYDAMRFANNEDIDGFGTIAVGVDWAATQHVQLRLNVFNSNAQQLLSDSQDRALSEPRPETNNEGSERIRGLKLRLQFIL